MFSVFKGIDNLLILIVLFFIVKTKPPIKLNIFYLQLLKYKQLNLQTSTNFLWKMQSKMTKIDYFIKKFSPPKRFKQLF